MEELRRTLDAAGIRIPEDRLALMGRYRLPSTVITSTFPPFFFSESNRKNSPVPNAMNESAISGRKSVPSTILCGIRSRQNGPISMPVSIYAVTFGSLSLDVTRVIRNPSRSMTETDMIVTAEGPSPSYNLFSIYVSVSKRYISLYHISRRKSTVFTFYLYLTPQKTRCIIIKKTAV